ncbi:MAG: RNA-protein complex protein Nop10 [Candidatus Methanoplasma sp.]|nr:RNA-protein complex protein Nop10 [Candidatus Methanoplasma sp.]
MASSFRRCTACKRYTMKDKCPSCGSMTTDPAPIKYSPEDRYGEYRRKAITEEYGENGKYRSL